LEARVRHVGIREFRDRASHYLASDEVLAIERHGRLIGYYIPVAPGTAEEVRAALERLNRAVERALATGPLDETTLSAALDLRRPA
jgi:hypothetical protein